jgi:hypothetical protein
MGEGRGCPEMPESSVEEGKGEYCREMSWSAGEWQEWEERRVCLNPPHLQGDSRGGRKGRGCRELPAIEMRGRSGAVARYYELARDCRN